MSWRSSYLFEDLKDLLVLKAHRASKESKEYPERMALMVSTALLDLKFCSFRIQNRLRSRLLDCRSGLG